MPYKERGLFEQVEKWSREQGGDEGTVDTRVTGSFCSAARSPPLGSPNRTAGAT